MESTPRHTALVPRISSAHLDAWRAVLNAHAAVVTQAESALAAAKLPSLAWYDLLWALKRAPGGRLRMTDLADSLTVSRGAVSKLVDRVEAAGLIRREDVPDDRRGCQAVLRPAGEDMLRAMWPVYSTVLRDHFARALSAEEAQTLAELLRGVPRTA